MSVFQKLQTLTERGRETRVGLIGAGKFSSMFLSQVTRMPGIHLVGIADLAPDRAFASLKRVGWPKEQYETSSCANAVNSGSTFVTDDAKAMITSDYVDIIIDATGNPAAGIHHALLCCSHGKHIIMVNVEADVLAGPLLARRAAEADIVYSMAYGDQPAIIAELVDWARVSGFDVVAAGKGTKYLPEYRESTPDTVWDHYGFSEAEIKSGDFNPQMFNSFLDGTKSAIEMAAVSNATGLTPMTKGLGFPPCGVDDLQDLLCPTSEGGVLEHKGTVEVVSSLERDGRPVYRDLRWGVYVTFEAPNDYAAKCFSQYGLRTSANGRYTAMYRPYHLIGLELGITVAHIAVNRTATASASCFGGDAVAVAKKSLREGDRLDGEGGYTVRGNLMTAEDSLNIAALPIGLANGLTLRRAVEAGETIRWQDVVYDEDVEAIRVRREMESMFGK